MKCCLKIFGKGILSIFPMRARTQPPTPATSTVSRCRMWSFCNLEAVVFERCWSSGPRGPRGIPAFFFVFPIQHHEVVVQGPLIPPVPVARHFDPFFKI